MPDFTFGKIEHVRQICRRLRPVLGEKMDGIYGAYLAEDADGRSQIEHYLELLAARHMPQDLGQDDTELIPPSRAEASGDYPIGWVNYAGKDLYEFGLTDAQWLQHTMLVGRSGAGKSNAGFIILKELHRHGKPFLIFDWKRNYRDLLSLPEFGDVEVYTIGRNIAPLAFNPLIPPAGTDPKTWLKKLNEVVAHAYCLGNGVLFLLQQAVDAVYEETGVYDGTVQHWGTFKDVMAKARGMDTRGREAGWLSSTLRALSSLCFGGMGDLLNSSNNRSIDHILDGNVILELDGLSQADKTFFVEACLLYLHHKKMAENTRERFSECVLIEEAHHVLSGQRTSLTGAESVMDTVYREIRELGVGLVLLDQMPSKLSTFALANTYCTICMSMSNKADISTMAQTLLLDSNKDVLGTLEVGQAVVKLQGRIARPFRISIPHFKIQKGRMTDADVRAHMQRLVPEVVNGVTRSTEDRPQAGRQANGHASGLDGLEVAFLKDVSLYPDSGVAARYRRLNLSARQGQKRKRRLLDKGLIEEQQETTTTGRVSRIALTEKGREILSEVPAAR
jgi:hypothetical protein